MQGDGNTIAAYAQELTRSYYDGYGLSNLADIYTGKLRKAETRILGTADWLETEMFYDAFGRTQETRSNHQLNLGDPAADVVSFTYDFADNVLKQAREHKVGSEVTTILEEMHYDHAGRLTANYHEINGGSKVQISELHYTPKDEIKEKNLGKVVGSFLQSLDFEYLPNGFLSRINQSSLGGVNMGTPSCTQGLPTPGAASSTPDNNDLLSGT